MTKKFRTAKQIIEEIDELNAQIAELYKDVNDDNVPDSDIDWSYIDESMDDINGDLADRATELAEWLKAAAWQVWLDNPNPHSDF